jgi:hypothetical protein
LALAALVCIVALVASLNLGEFVDDVAVSVGRPRGAASHRRLWEHGRHDDRVRVGTIGFVTAALGLATLGIFLARNGWRTPIWTRDERCSRGPARPR